ncbi:hypothetical protein H105_08883 [Trichophyton soudanense CBS 452.61]|uniref:Uncharacterized protein n=1 Tax=Trichophyton soudanense CBS 452.61 TaxID=1215331 RepID=A0A022XD15_TRISD|nr:hypothetical protein H105_08883 [Trichophyton soudanense CBS 452.61]KMQ43915.1 hypothetical protein HL42_5442 [Trichophyton rubrum]
MPREIGEMAIYSVAFHENSGKVLSLVHEELSTVNEYYPYFPSPVGYFCWLLVISLKTQPQNLYQTSFPLQSMDINSFRHLAALLSCLCLPTKQPQMQKSPLMTLVKTCATCDSPGIG